MDFDKDNFLDNDKVRLILQHVVDAGEVGMFFWNMEEHRVTVMEKITGRNFDHVKNLPYFIHQVTYKKDREIAMQDLEKFMNGDEPYYQSTFRILNEADEIRWIFCKGTLVDEDVLGVTMYDVTSDKFMQGHDRNTNLINVPMFMRKLTNFIRYSEHTQQKGALLYMEIDNLQSIINKYGFMFGSQVIKQFSNKLLEFVSEDEDLARFPYDKFMMILNNIEDLNDVKRISQNIRDVFKEPFQIEGREVYLTVNMGVMIYPEISSDPIELVRFSDFALSHSRESGSNQIAFFDGDLMKSYNRVMDIESELPRAISDDELYLVYQPQLDLITNKITGFEALLRWKNKNLGFISPAEFIPVAEMNGHIISLGHWTRKESIKIIRKWLDMGIEFDTISVNVSAVELQQKDFKGRLLHVCYQNDVEPHKIELEITERTLVDTTDENKIIIDDLIEAGFKIAIDDFGTGYSNLRSLLNFEINTLKLDKSLVDNIHDEGQSRILQGVLSAKNFLHYSVVAEGVEDKETMAILADLGFDAIQGFYFCRPLPQVEMEEFIFNFNTTTV